MCALRQVEQFRRDGGGKDPEGVPEGPFAIPAKTFVRRGPRGPHL